MYLSAEELTAIGAADDMNAHALDIAASFLDYHQDMHDREIEMFLTDAPAEDVAHWLAGPDGDPDTISDAQIAEASGAIARLASLAHGQRQAVLS